MYKFEFLDPTGKGLFTSDDNLFRLIAHLKNQPRSGAVNIPGLGGQGALEVLCFGTGWKGGYSSSGGIGFARDYFALSGDSLSWDIPLSIQVGGLIPPVDSLDILDMYVFVR